MRRMLPPHSATSRHTARHVPEEAAVHLIATARADGQPFIGGAGTTTEVHGEAAVPAFHRSAAQVTDAVALHEAPVVAEPPDRVVRTRGSRSGAAVSSVPFRARPVARHRIRCGDCAGVGYLHEEGYAADECASPHWCGSACETCRECRGTGYLICDHCKSRHANGRAPVPIYESWCAECADAVRTVFSAEAGQLLRDAGLPPDVPVPFARELLRVFGEFLAEDIPECSFFRADWLHTRTTRLLGGASPFEALVGHRYVAVARLILEQTGDASPLAMALALADRRPRRSALARVGVVFAQLARAGRDSAGVYRRARERSLRVSAILGTTGGALVGTHVVTKTEHPAAFYQHFTHFARLAHAHAESGYSMDDLRQTIELFMAVWGPVGGAPQALGILDRVSAHWASTCNPELTRQPDHATASVRSAA